jgi:hypothetical protein
VTDEQQIAALREAIRRAGWVTHRLRLFAVIGVSFPFALIAALGTLLSGWGTALEYITYAGAAALVSAEIALPAGAFSRWVRRRRIRGWLADLPPGQMADVLTSLRNDRLGDTRKLAAGLRRDFGLRRELAPATAPEARGDEPSPS